MRESTTPSDNPSAPQGPISEELLRAVVRNKAERKLFVDKEKLHFVYFLHRALADETVTEFQRDLLGQLAFFAAQSDGMMVEFDIPVLAQLLQCSTEKVLRAARALSKGGYVDVLWDNAVSLRDPLEDEDWEAEDEEEEA